MDLNLRNVPEGLVKRLKVEAAGRGVTLREYCLGLLGGKEVVGVKVGLSEPERVLESPVVQVVSSRRCEHIGHAGFQRGDGWWCMTCRKVY